MTRYFHHGDAEKRVEAAFFIHLVLFIIANGLLITINLSNRPDFLWFYWPLLGWGIGLLAHYGIVFMSPKTKDRLIHRQLRRKRKHASG